jgi:hypothetical protein
MFKNDSPVLTEHYSRHINIRFGFLDQFLDLAKSTSGKYVKFDDGRIEASQNIGDRFSAHGQTDVMISTTIHNRNISRQKMRLEMSTTALSTPPGLIRRMQYVHNFETSGHERLEKLARVMDGPIAYEHMYGDFQMRIRTAHHLSHTKTFVRLNPVTRYV